MADIFPYISTMLVIIDKNWGPLGGLAPSCPRKAGTLSRTERRRTVAACEGETESGVTSS